MTDSRISLLIGANIPKAHWVLDQRRVDPNEPYAIKSPLGRVILGPMSSTTKMIEESKVIPSINATKTSAAGARASYSSASQSSFETNLPPIEPSVSTETTDTRKEEQMDTEKANVLDLFPCPLDTMQAQSGAQLQT